MRGLKTFVSILQGKAIVLVKRDEHEAEVLVGKGISKQFAVNSMVSAIKAVML